jgi:uncharacterized protein with HEPN domain
VTGKPERAVGYVDHMLQAADGIGMFIAGLSKADFLASAMASAAVIRNLEIIGEASRRVLERCPAVAAAHPTVPWREVYRMRNRVAHGYDTVSLEIVWTIASRDVPVLTTQLRDALDALQTQAP